MPGETIPSATPPLPPPTAAGSVVTQIGENGDTIRTTTGTVAIPLDPTSTLRAGATSVDGEEPKATIGVYNVDGNTTASVVVDPVAPSVTFRAGGVASLDNIPVTPGVPPDPTKPIEEGINAAVNVETVFGQNDNGQYDIDATVDARAAVTLIQGDFELGIGGGAVVGPNGVTFDASAAASAGLVNIETEDYKLAVGATAAARISDPPGDDRPTTSFEAGLGLSYEDRIGTVEAGVSYVNTNGEQTLGGNIELGTEIFPGTALTAGADATYPIGGARRRF